ncbi:Mo-dependent nitrogenase C-terminal domain-containing protein [Phormidesmis priestleyi]
MVHFFNRLIPCPFERNIRCFGRVLLHILPLCKLNPLYEQLVGLRFKALCYLSDVCGEDIAAYCWVAKNRLEAFKLRISL